MSRFKETYLFIITGMLAAVSCTLAVIAAVTTDWLRKCTTSQTLGLFMSCDGFSCGGIPQEMESHSRKAVLAMLLLGIIFQFISLFLFFVFMCKKKFDKKTKWIPSLFAIVCFTIVVGVFLSPVGLEGLEGTWNRGSGINYVIAALVASFLSCIPALFRCLTKDPGQDLNRSSVFAGPLLATSLTVLVVSAVSSQWAFSPINSQTIGLFSVCDAGTCRLLPTSKLIANPLRMVVASATILATLLQCICIVFYITFLLCRRIQLKGVGILCSILSNCFLLIAVASFGSAKSLEDLSGIWERGTSYDEAIAALFLGVLASYYFILAKTDGGSKQVEEKYELRENTRLEGSKTEDTRAQTALNTETGAISVKNTNNQH